MEIIIYFKTLPTFTSLANCGENMIKCDQCGEEFKNEQGLSGHRTFKHKREVLFPKLGKEKVSKILIGGEVFEVNDLQLGIASVSSLKYFSMQQEVSMDTAVRILLKSFRNAKNLSEQIELLKEIFVIVKCPECRGDFYAPRKWKESNSPVFCCYYGHQLWLTEPE